MVRTGDQADDRVSRQIAPYIISHHSANERLGEWAQDRGLPFDC